ncbi:hypothetical protein ILUMI_07873 [Ignelater luminosus]|uniref:RWD domain-containing protein n=1 Tax=Ignelater luminosus TaxID=2038154 RepID=A0A8K0GDY9_IGNLU|nr:hypothetical protein ILUMI_07873 [Ignelater luminosus]
MSEVEFQDEEREALLSIYDGDVAFKQLSSTVFQYKFGENDNAKSLLLEIKWGDKYPTEKPEINMDTFYNKHINQSLKDKIKELVLIEAEQYLGMSMTYSLFEFVKEKFDELIKEQPEEENEISDDVIKDLNISQPIIEDIKKKPPKKEHLTKAQKRRQWDRVGEKGERPRGWDWVDLVKHLSQTGSKDDQLPSSTS